MAGMGFLHGGGHGHGSDGHHGGIDHHHGGIADAHHGHGHAPAAIHGPHGAAHGGGHVGHADHGAHAHGDHHGEAAGRGSSVVSHWGLAKLLPFLSPLNLFSMALGAGATGILTRTFLSGPVLTIAAIAGALVFDLAIVRPIMSLMIRFGSRPSEGLEGKVATIAEACTSFDQQGRGLVRLTLDGQIVQLLGKLDPHEVVTVHKGDKLLVMEVDASKGTCKVTRETTEYLQDATN